LPSGAQYSNKSVALHSPISSPKVIFHIDKMSLFSKRKLFCFWRVWIIIISHDLPSFHYENVIWIIYLFIYLFIYTIAWHNSKFSICQQQGFFFPQFCDVASHTGDRPQEELAKFSYRSEREVEKFNSLAMFCPSAGTYCLNMAT